jgi:phosphoglycolate phosphatase-like HAD superfamily hydrolase
MPEELTNDYLDAFRQVRPIMETGYEASLIMRVLYEGQSADTLLNQFESQLNHIIRRDLIDVDLLKKRFGTIRDEWIQNDLDSWIAQNPLFAGIKSVLKRLPIEQTVIITTKQERFVKAIFEANDIEFYDEHIFGLDRNMPKSDILAELSNEYAEILFVEDRLPTLLKLNEDNRIDHIELFFADWGYNTETDKDTAQQHNRIEYLTLDGIKTL